MDLEIGSHLYRNTDGTVEIEGVPQVTVGLRKPSGPLLVNLVVYDEVGRVTAKMVESALAFNERRALGLEKTPTSLLIKHVESGKVVLKVELRETGRVVISQGEFLTIKAHRLEVSPIGWSVDRHRMGSGETDLKGGPVVIG